MKKFEEKWNGKDNLDFYVDCKILPWMEENTPLTNEACMMLAKKYEEDDSITETASLSRRPTNRAARRKATAKAKRHLRKIEPLTASIRQTRNGGIIRKGDTWSWLPEYKKSDRRKTRHEGKSICREYFDDSAIPTKGKVTIDIDDEDDFLGGYWDTEAQSFRYDLEDYPDYEDWELEDDDDSPSLEALLRETEHMTFPCILTAQTWYECDCGINTNVFCLGLCRDLEEAKAEVTALFDFEMESGNFEYMTLTACPLKGNTRVGGAFYRE